MPFTQSPENRGLGASFGEPSLETRQGFDPLPMELDILPGTTPLSPAIGRTARISLEDIVTATIIKGSQTDSDGKAYEYDSQTGQMTKESWDRYITSTDESNSRERTNRDDMQRRASTNADDNRRDRRTRDDQARSERRRARDAAEAILRQGISYDWRGRKIGSDGKIIKNR